MSSSPENLNSSLSGGTRRATSRRRLRSRAGPRACRAPRRFNNGGRGKRSRCSKAVSAKLESLKNLINPSSQGEKAIKAEELFQETADYIVLLRTQVVILQRLVEFYGSSDTENTAATTVL